MKLKDFQLEAEALFSEAVFGHGFLHYGYWPEGRPGVPSLMALGQAQQVYFDHLAAHIPEDVTTILDVGSGTGANAKVLIARGFSLECLCPSEQLNRMAARKMPDVTIHTSPFEKFENDRRFDLCLFAESFHYIELRPALRQAARYAQRYVLIFDYFRRQSNGEDDTRGTHQDFLEAVREMGDFQVETDIDETELILPTFWVLDHVKNTHVAPFVQRMRKDLRASRRLTSFVLERVLRKVLNKAEARADRHDRFAHNREYRLILLKKSG